MTFFINNPSMHPSQPKNIESNSWRVLEFVLLKVRLRLSAYLYVCMLLRVCVGVCMFVYLCVCVWCSSNRIHDLILVSQSDSRAHHHCPR